MTTGTGPGFRKIVAETHAVYDAAQPIGVEYASEFFSRAPRYRAKAVLACDIMNAIAEYEREHGQAALRASLASKDLALDDLRTLLAEARAESTRVAERLRLLESDRDVIRDLCDGRRAK